MVTDDRGFGSWLRLFDFPNWRFLRDIGTGGHPVNFVALIQRVQITCGRRISEGLGLGHRGRVPPEHGLGDPE